MINIFDSEIEYLKKQNNYRKNKDFEKRADKIFIDNKWKYNLCSNDYLSLSHNYELLQEFKESQFLNKFFVGSTSSRYISGGSREYVLLEKLFSDLSRKESIICNSGYHANLGIIPALAINDTEFFIDRLCHSSIVDGVLLSKSKFQRYKHGSIKDLKNKLELSKSKNKIVITEGVFSMDGDVQDILELTYLKADFNFLLYIDDSHGFFTKGKNLMGVCDYQNVLDKVDVLVTGFGKSCATMGALVSTNKTLKNYFINKSKTFIYSTALPPVCIGWLIYLLRDKKDFLISQQKKLDTKILYFNSLLKTKNKSAIFPFMIGNNKKTIDVSNKILEQGFYISAIKPPTVPKGTSRLRVSIFSDVKEIILKELAEVLMDTMTLSNTIPK